MAFKLAVLCLAIILGSNALPLEEKDRDLSQFFDRSNPSARIVGGSNSGPVPYIMGMSSGNISRSFVCGGFIITASTSITAAHCVRAVGGNNMNNSVRGVVGTERWNSGGVTFTFRRALMHPNYNHNLIKNDIAITYMAQPIRLSATIQAVPFSWDFAGANLAARVTGWGRLAAGGASPQQLQELRTTVIDGARCVRDLASRAQQLGVRVPHVDPNVEVCTFHSMNHGTCHGDSGSPLVRADRPQVIGIVSWGVPCARGAPDMYVRTSAFRSWITTNTVN